MVIHNAMKQVQSPQVIPRQDHPISRSLISPNVLRILYRLKQNGHVAYLVGGGVRDLLLGREPKDFDVATDATPGRIKKLFRNCRLVGRRFRLAHLHFSGEIVEVSTFRADSSAAPEEGGDDASSQCVVSGQSLRVVSEDGMVLQDNVFGSPADDARRRDFTINALAYNIADFSIIDHVGGMKDLSNGVIRTIGDPELRFVEDPVRMLRAIRFAALLGFTVERESWAALKANAVAITRAAPPRLYEEFLKLFLSGKGGSIYQLMRKGELFAPLFPGFDEWLTRETGGFPHARVGENLDWIDSRLAQGNPVSPPLLIALMFGEYLEERADEYRAQGMCFQDAMTAAVSEFVLEQAPFVTIPHRVSLAVREILTLQGRFAKIPGKRPQAVLSRPAFNDALEYLRCQCGVAKQGTPVLSWWENFARDKFLPPIAEQTTGPLRKRSRRRRKRKPRAVSATF